MALANTIETSETPVHAYVYGISASFGTILTAVAHRRFAHKRATFMIHSLASGAYGMIQDLVENVEQKVKLQDMLEEIYLENTKITKKKLKEIREKKQDWYFTGEEALELGLIDELIESKRKVK
ncbi:ClpP family protease [Sporosarcina sp. FSL W7-1283]|uniref:ClpP family protease n=1 Tax=Sporosarcina sp. FSL W7-1283 TaxID=2921560 RepID=UPI0030F59D53